MLKKTRDIYQIDQFKWIAASISYPKVKDDRHFTVFVCNGELAFSVKSLVAVFFDSLKTECILELI